MASANPQETIRSAAQLARAGRLDEASVLVASAMPSGGGDPVLAALGGAIEFHRGQFERAAAYLAVAHKAHPADITVRTNLAESLYRLGRGAEALPLCDEASARADRSLRLARLGAHLAQEAGDFPRAIALYRFIVEAVPEDWGAWNNLGNAHSGADDHNAAAEALQRAVALAPDAAPIRVNLGTALIEADRADEGYAVLQAAARDFPDDPKPLLTVFNLMKAAGAEDEAYKAIAEAACRAPGDAHILSDHGQQAARCSHYAEAERAYEAALAIEPGLGPSLVGLASVYERMNREDELDPLRERAVAAGADGESLAFIDALRFKRAGQFEEAFAALEKVGDGVGDGRKQHLRGTILDRMGRADEAFAAFTEMNAHWQQDPSQPTERARDYRETARRAMDRLDHDWISGWQAPLDDGRRAPVFLLGFPRSGTTLLDTMLMGDAGTCVLEEEPFIGEAERALGGAEALGEASPQALSAAREAYFASVESVVGQVAGRLVIDKHPMHLNQVATIRRLFPDARFILALRHPCDVLLSCYLTNFRINNAMANFLDLGDAAELYELSFRHWEKARAVFDLPVWTVVYERLVEDAPRELRGLFGWLGLDWPEDGLDHREAARARGTVLTASYSQVTEPIYKRAAGRWHRYERYLEPVFPVLAPWVERWGYSLTDGTIPAWPEAEEAQA